MGWFQTTIIKWEIIVLQWRVLSSICKDTIPVKHNKTKHNKTRYDCTRKLRPKVTHSACQGQVYFHYGTTPAPASFGTWCVFLAPGSINGTGAQALCASLSSANLKNLAFHLTGEPWAWKGHCRRSMTAGVPLWINMHSLITFRTWPVAGTSNLELYAG